MTKVGAGEEHPERCEVPVTCLHCHQPGHKKRQCPDKKQGDAGDAKKPRPAGHQKKQTGGHPPAKQPAKAGTGGRLALALDGVAAKAEDDYWHTKASHQSQAGDVVDEEPAGAGGASLAAGFPAVMELNDHYRLPEQLLIDIAIDENTTRELSLIHI